MHLIVMRHGEAGWHTLDRERELTEFGRHGVADVAAQIERTLRTAAATRAARAASVRNLFMAHSLRVGGSTRTRPRGGATVAIVGDW